MRSHIITTIEHNDLRFPLPEGAGSDAVHTDPEYSLAVTALRTDRGLRGTGFVLTLGAGNRLVTRIPTFGQMILGFTLPFALAFVAIPLEYCVSSGRIVLGAALVLALRSAAFALRVLANLAKEAGKLAIVAYDVIIFAPLAVERWIAKVREQGSDGRRMTRLKPATRAAAGSEEGL